MSQNEQSQSQTQTQANNDRQANGESDTQTVTAKKVAQESKEAIDAAGELAAKTKDEYISKLSKKLDEFDQQLEEWKAKGSEFQGEAKAEWDKKLESLRAEREMLNEQIEQLKSSSGDAWQELKIGTSRAFEDLQKSFKNAAEAFSS